MTETIKKELKRQLCMADENDLVIFSWFDCLPVLGDYDLLYEVHAASIYSAFKACGISSETILSDFLPYIKTCKKEKLLQISDADLVNKIALYRPYVRKFLLLMKKLAKDRMEQDIFLEEEEMDPDLTDLILKENLAPNWFEVVFSYCTETERKILLILSVLFHYGMRRKESERKEDLLRKAWEDTVQSIFGNLPGGAADWMFENDPEDILDVFRIALEDF